MIFLFSKTPPGDYPSSSFQVPAMTTTRRQPQPDSVSNPPSWMKFAFGFMCALVATVALVGWGQWEDARRDYAAKQYELGLKIDRNKEAQEKMQGLESYLSKFDRSEDFRKRQAKERLGVTEEGEIILRFDPPPHPATGDAGKQP